MTKETTVKEVKFKVVEITEITKQDGQKFKAYKTLANGGRKIDLRFVSGCSNIPTEKCVIVCDANKCNVDETREYPILWVKDVLRIEGFEKKNNLAKYFG